MDVIHEYEHRCGEFSDIFQHLPRIHAEAFRPGVQIIELGTRSGNSTSALLAAAVANDGHVWSVDMDAPRVPPEWFALDEWTVIVGNDLDVVHLLPPSVDVLFIDTLHYYDQTVAELAAYVPKVKPGGVVLMHDTEFEHPDGCPSSDPAFPVRVAAEEYCAAHGFTEFEFVPGCYGLGVIHIPEEV